MRITVFLLGWFLLFPSIFTSTTQAQESKYWVFYTDKKDVTFNPYAYFDAKAIERRQLQGISLFDSSDFPLNKHYTSLVENLAEQTGFESRWFNAQIVYANETQINAIQSLPFVKKTILITPSWSVPAEIKPEDAEPESFAIDVDSGLLQQQLANMGGEWFVENGITGKGVRVAVFDVGFKGVDEHAAFEHLRSNNRILKTYDFVKDNEFVYDYGSHGRSVLSCIAGIYQGKMIGLAPEAEFLLARTEYATREPLAEEEFWMAAAEWADRNGADIINSSLGYTHHRYFVSDMNGATSLVTRAANMAASKGILVVNSMGNSGSDSWKYLGAPADADSILSIGAIHPNTLMHTNFSSFGPTADRRLKPNLTAFGHVMAAGASELNSTMGTSFSSPLVAGFAACVKQMHPDKKVMELFDLMQQAGNLYPYFDYAHGYGVPQASKFFETDNQIAQNHFSIHNKAAEITIMVNPESIHQPKEYLYYHIETPKKYLSYYAVIQVTQEEALSIPREKLQPGSILRVHFRGQTLEHRID